VKQKVGPDWLLFADFESSMVLMAYEKPICHHRPSYNSLNPTPAWPGSGKCDNCHVFHLNVGNQREDEKLEEILASALNIDISRNLCAGRGIGHNCNIRTVSNKFDLNADLVVGICRSVR